MKPLFLLSFLFSATFAFAADVPMDPTQTQPVQVGETVPNPGLKTVAGETLSLEKIREGEPTVLVFYRGGWCPYCTRHLSALQEVMPQLREKGWNLVAVSPDTPEKLQETLTEKSLTYTLVSDSTMQAARAFGLAFELDQKTLSMLDSYSIDIVAASGQTHHQLPVPAVYLINSDGTVRFMHHDPDYRERLDPEAVLRAVE